MSPDGLDLTHAGALDQEGVAELLRSADVLVDASWWQGFGRPGLEAMACGTPAVVTPHGGIGAYARDGENCLQPEPGDVEAVADAIERVLDDDGLRSRLVDAGLETARRFGAEVEADRWVSLLRQVAGGED